MALPATGSLSMSEINVELTKSSTATISMDDADFRVLAGIATGATSMEVLRGKSYDFGFSIASNITNANLRTLALASGWDGVRPVVATINSGVRVYSTAVGTYALTINGSWPNGVTLINNGVIVGDGGNGGAGGTTNLNGTTVNVGSPGSAGGPALLVSSAVSINNASGIIGGGGGGGGGGGAGETRWVSSSNRSYTTQGTGGGGGGGIRSGSGGAYSSNYNIANQGGTITNGTAGAAGTLTAAGLGGAGSDCDNGSLHFVGGAGGNGGSYGAAGAKGGTARQLIARGSGVLRAGGNGGAAGACVAGNANITWISFGQRYGSIG